MPERLAILGRCWWVRTASRIESPGWLGLALIGVYLRLGRFRDASQEVEKVLEREPANAEALQFKQQLLRRR